MKTTVEIEDGLYRAAKKQAIDEGITFRRLLEDALRARVPTRARSKRPKASKLPEGTKVTDRAFWDYWFDELKIPASALAPEASSTTDDEPNWRADLYEERIEHLLEIARQGQKR